MKIFIALYERMHWVVDSSVILGLHPDLNPGRTPAELALALQLWQQYSHERKRRSDALRPAPNELCTKRRRSSTRRMASLLRAWIRSCISIPSALVDRDEPWRAWWLRQPALHPYNECFLPLHPEFPVFSSADFDHAQVRSLVAEDVDPSAPTPPFCSAQAPTPANREELSIFESILEASDDASA
ncbi:hypothetical protein PF005_g27739 [Phytophthora fragariae]|uniref:Uncharacterized protein n=1 Tax=Phytophthora fragariae TaxID=53985 RepID=A0A6A3VMC0_9STRA|nr:hypothetical protein PF005_g27739 [Phytophthora fragariae]